MYYVKDNITGIVIESSDHPNDFSKNMSQCTPPITNFSVFEDTWENIQVIMKDAELTNRNALQVWVEDMEKFKMTRQTENLITKHFNGVAGDDYDQAEYDAKIKLRATKP